MCFSDLESQVGLLRVGSGRRRIGFRAKHRWVSPSDSALALWVALGYLALASLRAASPTAAGDRAAAGHVDFNREIRPIFSENCFACHGPDDKARKAKFRLDVKADAFKPLKSGELAIVPGQPTRSRLIDRLTTKDPDDLMPPSKTGKTLSPKQIDSIRRWIAEGAEWPAHWAFVKPERPAVPPVSNPRWPQNPIDQFALARLDREGLKPAPEAEKTTLIRRATLDLTGLPPTVEEVDAFLADKAPQAYEKLVDRLLASPRYGEHMAHYWLDAVRYADSHGYHIDSQRDIWAYRDWVVDAFNANKPFDAFTREQLAGDLVPDATREQKIGSGYLRCNMSTGEGGAIEAEYQAKYAFDRVETTGTVWLGLTLLCSRCHSHKYDPIMQKEYYGLYAIFNSLDEPVMDGNKPNPDPFLKLASKQQTERLEWLKQHLTDGQARVEAAVPDLDEAQVKWRAAGHERLRGGWTNLPITQLQSSKTNGATLKQLADGSVLASGENPEQDRYELTMLPGDGSLAGLRLEALPDDSLPQKGSGRAEDGRFALSELEAELSIPDGEGKPPKIGPLKLVRAMADRADKDAEVEKAIDGKPDTVWAVDAKAATEPRTAIFLLPEAVHVPPGAKLNLRLRFEGGGGKRALGRFRVAVAQGAELVRLLNPPKAEPWQVIGPFKTDGLEAGFNTAYGPEQEVDLKKAYAGVREEIRWTARPDLADGGSHVLVDALHGVHGAYYFARTIEAPVPMKLELSLRADDLFKVWLNGKQVMERSAPAPVGGPPARVTVELAPGSSRLLIKVVNHQGAARFAFSESRRDTDYVSPELTAILSTTAAPAGVWRDKARNDYRRLHSAEFHQLFVNLEDWRQEQTAINDSIPTTLVAREGEKMRDTFFLMRGEYDKPGDKVAPGVPSILPPLPKDAPPNRLGLAAWLLDPSHPLTARVNVNRFWQQFFGVGLVKTVEDFGAQGERPSHPELLDWLATEFIDSGWDIKHLHRLILRSATYRQTSRATPELRARDPENRLLARGPRFRVDAEAVRDTLLYIGGLLVDQRGGRSVKPYEPPGLWEAVSYNNAQKYVPETGQNGHRRSLYTYWKRQSPPPNMLIFDAPTREFCVARRPRTNTPLQALVLLNDPQFVEAARALARRMLVEAGPDIATRLTYGFRLATGRSPHRDEVRVLQGVLEAQLAAYRRDPAAAARLLAFGSFIVKDKLPPADLAAWTTIASMLLNLDETVTKG